MELLHDYTFKRYSYGSDSVGGTTTGSSTSSLASMRSSGYEDLSSIVPFVPAHHSSPVHSMRRPMMLVPVSRSRSSSSSTMSHPIRVSAPVNNRNYQEARYKTELCLHFRENDTCPHGTRCLFAHGLAELRPYKGRHPKHKTQLCRSFHETGFCNYGYRCSYIHLESPETIKYLRSLNVKLPERKRGGGKPMDSVRFTSRDRIQFKHKSNGPSTGHGHHL